MQINTFSNCDAKGASRSKKTQLNRDVIYFSSSSEAF